MTDPTDTIAAAWALISPLTAATPAPWICYADLPSAEPDWHIITTVNRMRVLANVHIEPGNATDAANSALIAAAPAMRDTLAALADLAEAQEQRIEFMEGAIGRMLVAVHEVCSFEQYYSEPLTGAVDEAVAAKSVNGCIAYEATERAKLEMRIDAMWSLLRAGADLLSEEADALKAGIGIAGEWETCSDPVDQPTVEAIREIEAWIGRVAALQPTPTTGETE